MVMRTDASTGPPRRVGNLSGGVGNAGYGPYTCNPESISAGSNVLARCAPRVSFGSNSMTIPIGTPARGSTTLNCHPGKQSAICCAIESTSGSLGDIRFKGSRYLRIQRFQGSRFQRFQVPYPLGHECEEHTGRYVSTSAPGGIGRHGETNSHARDYRRRTALPETRVEDITGLFEATSPADSRGFQCAPFPLKLYWIHGSYPHTAG